MLTPAQQWEADRAERRRIQKLLAAAWAKENESRLLVKLDMEGQEGLLSRREEEVITLIRERKTNKEIAIEMNLSERGVKFHVSNILFKLGLKKREEVW